MTAKIHVLFPVIEAPPAIAEETQVNPLQKKTGKKRHVRNPLPCGRNSPWKKKMDGTVVRRKKCARP
jgi:hypothetical protein